MSNQENWNVPNKSERKRVTLHQVAEHAGISKSTVSLVLQNSPSVSPKTRELVLRSIQATGYVYNRKAAALRRSSDNHLIGILLNNFNTPYIGEILSHLEQASLRRNIVPMIASSSEQLTQQEKLSQIHMEYNVGGFILCPVPNTSVAWIDQLWRNGYPVVQMMREVPFSRFPAVVADNRQGMQQATQHLIQSGHKKIAFLGGQENISDFHERLAGFMDAMNQAGLHVPNHLIYPIAQARHAGQQALNAVLAHDPDITAVVCFSDLIAYGVLSLSRKLGINIGSDLAVVAFDDIAESQLAYPALTTVRVEAAALADNALQLLQNYLHNPQASIEKVIIPAQLMVRESCGTSIISNQNAAFMQPISSSEENS